MQRERSRSRDAASVQPIHAASTHSTHASLPDSAASSSESSPVDLFDWELIFTDMPFEPLAAQAGPAGPSTDEASRAVGLPTHEVVAVYPVTYLAQHRDEYIALLECQQDHVGHGSEVLILFDVLCQDRAAGVIEGGPMDLGPHLFHSAHISRTWTSFAAVAHIFRLTHMLQTYPNSVTVVHNGHVWSPDDLALRRLRNGDHLEVVFEDNHDPAFRGDLITWLRIEGLNPWPALEAEASQMVIQPTLPFVIQDLPVGDFCDHGPDGLPQHAFSTWFVSHRSFETCRDPRVVAFVGSPLDWKTALSQVWADRWDPSSPFTITWISPQPHQDRVGDMGHLPQLVVEQHQRAHRIAVHLTAVIGSGADQQVTQSVFAIADFVPVATYLELMTLDRLCARRFTCQVTHDGRRIQDTELIHRPTGQALHIRAFARDVDTGDPEPFTLMQVASQVPASREVLQPDTGGSALTSDTSEPTTSDTTADLTCPPQRPEPVVCTYFLSPRILPVCAFPRLVDFADNALDWQHNILNVWSDLVDSSAPWDIVTVNPLPRSNYGPRDAAVVFAIVYQHLSPPLCPVLVTLEEDNDFIHIAALVSTPATVREIFTSVGQGRRCLNRASSYRCTLRSQDGRWIRHSVQEAHSWGWPLEKLLILPLTCRLCHVQLGSLPLVSSLTRRLTRVRSGLEKAEACERNSRDPKVTLCLEESLAVRSTFIDFGSVLDLHEALSELDLPVWHGWPPGFLANEPSLQCAFHVPTWTTEIPKRFIFYTDASYSGTSAVGVGVVLLVLTDSGLRLGGSLACAHFGSSSFSGEQIALGWALVWAQQLQLRHDLQLRTPVGFDFFFDAQAAGYMAAGWMQPHSSCIMATFLRAQGLRLEEFWGHEWIRWHHIHGHTGVFWNEIADRLAHLGRNSMAISEPGWLALLEDKNVPLAWLWAIKPLLCGLVGRQLIHSSSSPAVIPDHHFAAWKTVAPQPAPDPPPLGRLKAAAANVLALSDKTANGIAITGARQLSLMQQFHRRATHFVGVQETRHHHRFAIDAYAQDAENLSGRIFHEWLLQHFMIVPATFEHFHVGRSTTHVNPSGFEVRIDFVCFSRQSVFFDFASTVDDSVDLTSVRDDHFAAFGEASFRCRAPGPRPRHRRHRDPADLCHLFATQETADAVSWALPRAQWHQSVHQDALDFSDACLQITKWIPERPLRRPRKRHLHPETWNLIQYKQVSTLHSKIYEALRDGGFDFAPTEGLPAEDAPQLPEPLTVDFPCPHCDRVFTSKQSLAAHAYQQHEVASVEWQYVLTPVCPGCLRNFWTSRRLQQHLRYRRNRCFDKVHGTRDFAEGCSIQLDPQHQHIKRLQVFRNVHGPLRPTPSQRAKAVLLGQLCQLWWDRPWFRLYAQDPPPFVSVCHRELDLFLGAFVNLQLPADMDLHSACLDLLQLHSPDEQSAALCLFDWVWTLLSRDSFEDACTPFIRLAEDFDDWPAYQAMRRLQTALEEVEPEPVFPVLPRRQAQGYVDRRYPLPSRFGALHHEEADRRTWTLREDTHVPRDLAASYKLVIHLFSGRRRKGDFQSFAEIMLKGLTGYLVMSIDTAVSAAMNIFEDRTWSFLWQAAKEGHVHSLLLGPPCESWSEARYMEIIDAKGFKRRGPRPLRSFERLWGLPSLALREYGQLHLGNQLLLRGLWLGVLTRMSSGRVVVEHPHAPEDLARPTIWRSAILQHLCATGLFAQHHILQYRYGSPGVKPTTLLCGGISVSRLDKWAREDFVKPATALVGIGANGKFKTFVAKEYPPLLNAAFAHSMLWNADSGVEESLAATPEWALLATEFAAAAHQSTEGVILSDCQMHS
eukprot:Skav204029  [mRNA]  locus=scaffold1162:12735:20907:+ [translate_table: standard]